MKKKNNRYEQISVSTWVAIHLMLCIPIVNVILLFVWAFGGNTFVSLSNYAKASLILWLSAIVIYVSCYYAQLLLYFW